MCGALPLPPPQFPPCISARAPPPPTSAGCYGTSDAPISQGWFHRAEPPCSRGAFARLCLPLARGTDKLLRRAGGGPAGTGTGRPRYSAKHTDESMPIVTSDGVGVHQSQS